MTVEIAREQENSTANRVLISLAVAYFLLEWLPCFFGPYGYFIDEFYYVACSEHLALGYVDLPPLSVFILGLIRSVIGDSLPALRLVPALAGAMTIWLTGLIARRLGANLYGQALAAGAVMTGSIFHVMFSLYSMNALSLLLWATAFLILVEIERRNEPRLWIVLGVVAGLGLENKYTFVLLILGLSVGLLLSQARRHYASGWLWAGLVIAIVLLSPNLYWQIANDWPSLEFYSNADIYKNVPTPPFEILKQQFLFMNPAALPVWVAGLFFFLAARDGRRYQHLGWMFVTLLLLMLFGQKSRPDHIAAAYIILLAGGGVVFGEVLRRGRLLFVRVLLPIVLLLSGLAFAPLGLPLLPPETTASYSALLGIVPQIEEGEAKKSALPQWLADRCGWEKLVDDVEYSLKTLDETERKQAIILAPSYGQAGAIELLGRGRDFPPVYALHNSYALWGPPEDPVEVALFVGPFGEEVPNWLYYRVELVRVHDCEWCMPWRDELRIWLARDPKTPFSEAWPELVHFE